MRGRRGRQRRGGRGAFGPGRAQGHGRRRRVERGIRLRGWGGRPRRGEFIGIAADAVFGLGAAEDVAGDFALLCGASFSADAPVATLDGEKPISSLKVGDQVLAEDPSTGQVGSDPITATMAHADPQVAHLAINGERIDTTPDHRFYTEDRGWVQAKDLKPGERVREANGQSGAVESIAVESRPRTMYDLTVDRAHTFFVGNQQ